MGVIEELAWVKDRVKTIYEDVRKRYQVEIPFKFGTMIEVVRACMRANKLAEISEFFSFGTNDLTQATFSFSREDAEREFLPLYDKYQILQDNPFETLDEEGVGRLMMISVDFARRGQAGFKDRNLRRARRGPQSHLFLSQNRVELCLRFPPPGAHCPAGGRARCLGRPVGG